MVDFKKINVHFDILCFLTILSYFCIRKFSAILSSSFALPQFSADLYSGTIIKHMFILATIYLKLSFMYLTYFSLLADISKNYLQLDISVLQFILHFCSVIKFIHFVFCFNDHVSFLKIY